MGNRVKKVMMFRFNDYKAIESKLEKMATEGLMLEKLGSTFWTFKKAEPKNLKYTVTYFSEASIFNPSATENQEAYFDYARESGWRFVAELNQMQIFCNEEENPVPFETDEREKFDNIKKCMKKNFLPSTVALILVFMLNLFAQYDSYRINPIDFLSEASRLFPVAIFLPTIAYLIYTLIAYFVWCKQCEKSLEMGGTCVEKNHKYKTILDVGLITYDVLLLSWFLIDMFKNNNLPLIVLSIIYVPILALIYSCTIKVIKRRNKSARFNRVVSSVLLIVASFGYIGFVIIIVLGGKIPLDKKENYRTVNLKMTAGYIEEWRIYSEELPLTCEDLYGEIEYDNYSFEKETDSSIFLTRSQYSQLPLPEKNSPPEITYEILEPKFDFVFNIVVDSLKKIPSWSEKSIEPIENNIFNTVEAYEFYYENDKYNSGKEKNYTGEYLLVYQDRIISLKLEQPATEEQVFIIMEKLKLKDV